MGTPIANRELLQTLREDTAMEEGGGKVTLSDYREQPPSLGLENAAVSFVLVTRVRRRMKGVRAHDGGISAGQPNR